VSERRETDYDAIVIGSGMGGLVAASVLAQLKHYRVLVLEQHYTAGGFTHTFKRAGGFQWDVGLHYVGRMEPGDSLRKAFDFVTGGKVQWTKMKDPFEIFCYPGFRFSVHSDSRRYRADLISQFPSEAAGIKRYFRDLRIIPKLMLEPFLPAFLRPLFRLALWKFRKFLKLTVKEGLALYFKDERLKAVLASQWGDYGLPPGQASFVMHAVVAEHYLDGGYYPVGGSEGIASSMEAIIEAKAGRVLTQQRVSEILLEDGAAVGVRAHHKGQAKDYFAREIYSNAGAHNTYLHLLPASVAPEIRKDLVEKPPGDSAIFLYLGLKEDPRSLGIHGQNFWIYEGWDHDALFAKRGEVLEGKVHNCYVSFPSLKNPGASKHTAEILGFVPYDLFKEWESTAWKHRGPEYEELKRKIAASLLSLVEKQIPGFRDLVAYQELGTPLSVKHFSQHPSGQIYGFPATPDRLTRKYLRARTPIKNLFLVGTDAAGFGIVGAMIGGFFGVMAKHGAWLALRFFR
jgi:all-trans-retinol 13,14-reductase